MCSGGCCPTAQGPRSPARPQAPQSALASHGLAQLAGGDKALDWGFTHLGLFWMERSARLKARLRQDSSAELISRCKLVCSGGEECHQATRETQPDGNCRACSQGATGAVGQPAWLPASVWGGAWFAQQQDEYHPLDPDLSSPRRSPGPQASAGTSHLCRSESRAHLRAKDQDGESRRT